MKKIKLDFRKLKRVWSIGETIFSFIEDDALEYYTKYSKQFSIQQVFWSKETERAILNIQDETHKKYYRIDGKYYKRPEPFVEIPKRYQTDLSFDRLNWCPVIDDSVPFSYIYLDLENKDGKSVE